MNPYSTPFPSPSDMRGILKNQKPTVNYSPLRNLVLLKAARTEEKSDGGIYIPEQARDTLNEGCIVAIGPDVPHDNDLNIGDTVVFAKHSEWRVEIDGEVYIAVTYENLLLKKK